MDEQDKSVHMQICYLTLQVSFHFAEFQLGLNR